jgi:hypothetical protein
MSNYGKIWEHQTGDRYVLLVADIVGNPESGYDHSYLTTGTQFDFREDAWQAGLERLDRSDDFNLGVVRNWKLIAVLWNDQIVDDEPEVLADISAQLGLGS